jgi:Zn-finger protein
MNNEHWRGKAYSFFCHKTCESFPCHKNIEPEEFNCLFCYCPLYALGERCGGNMRYTARGVKDCSGCVLPHKRDNYGYVIGKFEELADLARQT